VRKTPSNYQLITDGILRLLLTPLRSTNDVLIVLIGSEDNHGRLPIASIGKNLLIVVSGVKLTYRDHCRMIVKRPKDVWLLSRILLLMQYARLIVRRHRSISAIALTVRRGIRGITVPST
jgi:hypothetical protein